MRKEKMTLGQWMNRISWLVSSGRQDIERTNEKFGAIKMPKETAKKYKELSSKFENILGELDEFQKSYDGSRDEEKETLSQRILYEADSLIDWNEHNARSLARYFYLAERRKENFGACRRLLLTMDKVMNDLEKWKRSYENKVQSVRVEQSRILDCFSTSEETFVVFYNKYLDLQKTPKNKIYDSRKEETKMAVNDFFAKSSPFDVLHAIPKDGSYNPKDRWCVIGLPMQSSNFPFDLVKDKEDFWEDVSIQYMENTFPDELKEILDNELKKCIVPEEICKDEPSMKSKF